MIGERIKLLRRKKKYSITELAKRAGVSKSYLSYIERDVQNNPSLQFLSKIAVTLDTTIEYLLGGEMNSKRTDELLDGEWTTLLQKAIDEGMSKADFKEYQDYIKFRNWRNAKEEFNNK
ncbi:helix-turn-helix domain-containing protein [Fredinandcohnia quinoae]|uniref:Helix-turn-helix domain-containing protein n=1 Tax=Fredinandcohnia quinoae TaxID=2918902 RepID=A0AAW5E2B3_9BACI|nr:helix-turn-helix transcriptional regulator [Fredinandcohnia sp. SECRCQ15]MCH1624904.1 helix-turn-helix domain-containing protein [Fredinandcohnia sp. SECRCQ15]